MRVRPGATVEETFAALSDAQKALVLEAKNLRDQEEAKFASIRRQTYRAVRTALQAGVPVIVLAEALGVTNPRIYQMRDQAVDVVPST